MIPRDFRVDSWRQAGWSVAVHNDYRLYGQVWMFWLFTHPSGIWAKGEGRSYAQALAAALEQARERVAALVPHQPSTTSP